jgi:hypothetical protein
MRVKAALIADLERPHRVAAGVNSICCANGYRTGKDRRQESYYFLTI